MLSKTDVQKNLPVTVTRFTQVIKIYSLDRTQSAYVLRHTLPRAVQHAGVIVDPEIFQIFVLQNGKFIKRSAVYVYVAHQTQPVMLRDLEPRDPPVMAEKDA